MAFRDRNASCIFAAQGGFMNRRNAIAIGVGILFSSLAFSIARSASADPRVVDFVKSGKIRAGLAQAPIIATKDPATGELRGVAVDLSRELAARIGVELVQVPYSRPGAVMAGLKSNAWDVAFLGIDPARAAEADFSPAYLEVDLKYLVPPNSSIRNLTDADTAGIRIAVPRGDLVDILLSERLKEAELVRADTVVGAFDLLQAGKAEVCALPLPSLLQYSALLPGSRILDESFGVNRVGIVVPKGQTAHLAYFSDFIEDAKASGFVQRAIERAGLRGVRVAPPAKSNTQ
jgi:polar amino acid transport system substrate-binding protein